MRYTVTEGNRNARTYEVFADSLADALDAYVGEDYDQGDDENDGLLVVTDEDGNEIYRTEPAQHDLVQLLHDIVNEVKWCAPDGVNERPPLSERMELLLSRYNALTGRK